MRGRVLLATMGFSRAKEARCKSWKGHLYIRGGGLEIETAYDM
jgi:hypothetical protein